MKKGKLISPKTNNTVKSKETKHRRKGKPYYPKHRAKKS